MDFVHRKFPVKTGLLGPYVEKRRQDAEQDEFNTQQFPSISDISMEDNRMSNPNKIYEQKIITHESLAKNLRFMNFLGSGTFGLVFRCSYEDQEFVGKIPVRMYKEGALVFLKDGRLAKNMDGTIPTEAILKTSIHVNAKQILSTIVRKYYDDFKEEYMFARMALEPRSSHNEIIGEAMTPKNWREFYLIQQERFEMKRHPGFRHIHQIVHYDREFPIILSEKCDGSLGTVMSMPNYRDLIGGIRFEHLMQDIHSAITYLRDIAKIYHLDIKPDNILFQAPVGRDRIRWILSDFGFCMKMTNIEDVLKESHGSPWFNRCIYSLKKTETHTHASLVSSLGFLYTCIYILILLDFGKDLTRLYDLPKRQDYFIQYVNTIKRDPRYSKQFQRLVNESKYWKPILLLLDVIDESQAKIHDITAEKDEIEKETIEDIQDIIKNVDAQIQDFIFQLE